jgi:glycosyltransferase involved in cell wall biosynthesis
MSIKYSIVIPTRNKIEYLPYAIKSVLENERIDFELIVSNNHSTDGTSEFLEHLNDNRLHVISPPLTLPMAGHYEFAINEARGEWITMLGDDDAVMPYIFDRLDFYINEHPEVDIISSERAYFFWQGCENLYGNIVVNYKSKQAATLRSTRSDLMMVLSGRRSCFDMPQIYTTSMVKRSLYQEIKESSGGYFYHSIIPDMYSVVALSLSRERYLRVEEPLFWVGTSNKSMGISNRIYLDANQFDNKKLSEFPCMPKKISDSVSYEIHSGGFSAMYIFECLLNFPLLSQNYHLKHIRSMVFSAVIADLKGTNKEKREKVILEIKNDCKVYGLSFFRIWLLGKMLIFERKTRNFMILPNRLKSILGHDSDIISYHSNSRFDYPTILHASKAIIQARLKLNYTQKKKMNRINIHQFFSKR